MEGKRNEPIDVVMSYTEALDSQRYEEAVRFLHENVRIRGPAGETIGGPSEFAEMLRKYRRKYDLKKVFVDSEDVCIVYDLAAVGATVSISSWYQVKNRKIVSIRTIFDPREFDQLAGQGSNVSQAR